MDDRQLWEGIRRKDASAFDTLYRSYGAGLLGFLKQFLGNRQAAEDVTQETFAGIWQHPNGFNPERGTLRSYIFGAGRKRAAECAMGKGFHTLRPSKGSERCERSQSSATTLGRQL